MKTYNEKIQSPDLTEANRLMCRLFDAAKQLLNVNAYELDNILLHRDLMGPDQINDIESARMDVMEAYTKIETIIKLRMGK